MTDDELLVAIRELLDSAAGRPIIGMAIDPGTAGRLYNALSDEEYYISMGGDHYILGQHAYFTEIAGVQLLFKMPQQME